MSFAVKGWGCGVPVPYIKPMGTELQTPEILYPVWEYALSLSSWPQHTTFPPAVTTQVWWYPTATDLIPVKPEGGVVRNLVSVLKDDSKAVYPPAEVTTAIWFGPILIFPALIPVTPLKTFLENPVFTTEGCRINSFVSEL